MSICSRYCARFLSPLASKNSVNVMGSICMKLTLPTGKEEGLASAMPSREPAQATWYCGAFSQKYFMALMTLGQSCTSSKMISVFSGWIVCPLASIRFCKMRSTFFVVSKNC